MADDIKTATPYTGEGAFIPEDGCPNPWARFNGCGSPPYFGPGYDFPNQFQYQQDIGWLIQAYKYWICKYNYIAETVAKIEGSLDGLDNRIIQAVNNAVQPVYQQIAMVRDEMKELQENVDAQLSVFSGRIQNINASLTKLEVYVNTILPAAQMYADMQDEKLKQFMLNYINNIAKEWPPVTDPSDGLTEDINTALRHMYNELSNGITYGELNGYMFTYGQLNNMHITYGQLNTKAFQIFDRQLDQRFYMFSPVDGKYLMWRDIVWQLYRLHYPGVTYGQINNKGITYGELDALGLTYGEFNEPGWITG